MGFDNGGGFTIYILVINCYLLKFSIEFACVQKLFATVCGKQGEFHQVLHPCYDLFLGARLHRYQLISCTASQYSMMTNTRLYEKKQIKMIHLQAFKVFRFVRFA